MPNGAAVGDSGSTTCSSWGRHGNLRGYVYPAAPKPPKVDTTQGPDRSTTPSAHLRAVRARAQAHGGNILWRTSGSPTTSIGCRYGHFAEWVDALGVGPGWKLHDPGEWQSDSQGTSRAHHTLPSFVRPAGPPDPAPARPSPRAYIYWARTCSPRTFLGNAARVGITSRWPSLCYRLGAEALGVSVTTGQIDYDISSAASSRS
jgi:hypothetical protein